AGDGGGFVQGSGATDGGADYASCGGTAAGDGERVDSERRTEGGDGEAGECVEKRDIIGRLSVCGGGAGERGAVLRAGASEGMGGDFVGAGLACGERAELCRPLPFRGRQRATQVPPIQGSADRDRKRMVYFTG